MGNDKNISFMRSLCMGQIEEDVVVPFPKIKDSERQTLKDMFQTVDPWLKGYEQEFRKWDRQGDLPESFIKEIKEMGLFGLVIPEAYGGLGLSSSAYSRFVQQLSTHDGSVAITVGEHS